MKIYSEIYDLQEFSPWSNAKHTWEKIIEADKGEEFIQHLDCIYPEGVTESQLNDLLWFEEEWCYELVNLNKWGVEPVHAEDFVGESIQIQKAIEEAINDYIKSDNNTEGYTEGDFDDLDASYFEDAVDEWLEENYCEETDYDTLAEKWLNDVGRGHIKDAVEQWFD